MTRARDDGFLIADFDTSFYSDPKVVAIAKRLRDASKTACVLTLYHALVLASWRQGERLTVAQAAPAWWLDPVDEERDLLEAAELVDADGRIHEHVWERWFVPAFGRRENRRENGRQGGLQSGKRRSSNASATVNPTVLHSVKQTGYPSVSPPGDGQVCPICAEPLASGSLADEGQRAVQRGGVTYDVHERCFLDQGAAWLKEIA
jgi:hypothetical protein